MIFFNLSEGMENCKMSGKSQGIWRWMISGNPGMNYFMLKFVISGKGGLNIQHTVKILKIGTPIIITIIVLQLEQLDFTVRYCVQKMQTE